jgi:hypothetical protein
LALPDRFQEAIDEAAMNLGLAGSDAYLEEWRHGDWEAADGSANDVAGTVAARLDAENDDARLKELMSA